MASQPEARIASSRGSRGAYYAWAGGVVFAAGFTLLIWVLGPSLQPFLDTLLPDQGAAWYYWKLPARDFWTMFIVWTFYLSHQFAIWAMIYLARNKAEFRTGSSSGLTKYNLAALTINGTFVFLHLLQTYIWFDGLAQDVPIWTSQGSVIIMLCIILIMENPRRGLFLGRRAGKPFTARVSGFFIRNHGYVIAWALVYTFWFHPMAFDPQLLSGFFYMFLLFTQMSLAYTRVHLDKRWIITLESYVAIHAVIVAVYNTAFLGSADMWPMFFAGFAFMFVFTYMYALDVPKKTYWTVTTIYLAFVAWLYLPAPFGLGRDLAFLLRLEVLWIPLALYGLSAAFAGLAYSALRKRGKG